ncbi:hypothetical protein MARCHEWKA_01860 [Brevundimonas phage vB_BpoS-Marchewka]|uniref:ATP-grasp domain-containing protein n=1 Tax=Brevundimonas phage vB_BpoS-Marchewka TaxID=2948604 RepID=A0A9E7SR36_9CAUD|nr:hypothetical protein MARCHEWKA_01860 [Brevundimonas phage vB_BpoS-Marchewka]UTC29145.1 hypothetical protein BAMBUS_00620 [Brevundimonas phage vB_BpoS-Bambus]
MHWVLQENMFGELAYAEFCRTLGRLGLPYSVHRVVPFIGTFLDEPQIDTNNAICMGSYSMRYKAAEMGWNPGVFDLEPFDFPVQHAHWGANMLNADSRVLPLREVNLGETRAFIRPSHDTKAFPAKVYDPFEFVEWQARVEKLGDMPREMLDRNTLVQVSPVREIYEEYRFWVIRGEIVCASLYKRGDRGLHDADVPLAYHEYVRAMIDIWQPHEAFVIDVANVPDDGDGWRGIKIIEINTINAAGFYAANLPKLAMAFEDAFNEG